MNVYLWTFVWDRYIVVADDDVGARLIGTANYGNSINWKKSAKVIKWNCKVTKIDRSKKGVAVELFHRG